MTALVEPAAGTAQDRLSIRDRVAAGLGQEFRLAAVAGILVLVWVFFWSREPLFLSSGNLSNLALQTVVTAVLALGISFVLFLGEIDLSVGAMGGVLAAVMGRLITDGGWNPWLAVLAAVLLGVVIGAIQGGLVVFGAPSFMVTLGFSIALGGLLLLVLPDTGSIDLSQTDISAIAGRFLQPSVSWTLLIVVSVVLVLLRLTDAAGQQGSSSRRNAVIAGAVGFVLAALAISYFNSSRGVPVAVALMIVLYLLAWYVTTQTRFGISIFAVGGNAAAARRAGLPVERIRILCFGLSGAFAGLAGIIAASRVLGVSNQSGGGDLLLQAIAAAVIGGTSLFGGRGSVWSALLGALMIGSVSNGMDLLGLGTEAKLIVTGGILVVAVLLDAIAIRGRFLPVAA